MLEDGRELMEIARQDLERASVFGEHERFAGRTYPWI